MHENLIVIDKLWFNNPTIRTGEIVGIITARDSVTGEVHAYIGTGSSGDADQDAEDILRWGTKINVDTLKSMI